MRGGREVRLDQEAGEGRKGSDPEWLEKGERKGEVVEGGES